MGMRISRLVLMISAATLWAGAAMAAPMNEPPPVGPVILDLDGTAIPHSYQTYSVNFFASSAATNLSFAFREDPAFLSLTNVSLTAFGGGTNLLTNGDFSLGPVGSSTPLDWTYLNTFGAAFGGVVDASCGNPTGNCYFDGAVQAYDGITQAVATTSGAEYTVTFDLSDDSGYSTFSSLSTNGDVSDTGGNGIDLLVYAGNIPVRNVPEPITLSLFGAGIAGAVAMRRRKKAKA
jgi:hypothetical protein